MTKFLIALAAVASFGAWAGQPEASAGEKYVTVEVCDGGESGTVCRTVTYKVRPASPAEPVECRVVRGEAGDMPCPTKYGVPRWLKELNQAFIDAGFEPPKQDDMVGGP